jgi:hypothetical protein
MKVNILTIGQNAHPKMGKYSRKSGYVRRLFFMADSHNVGYYCQLRIAGVGLRKYPVSLVEVTK